MAQLTSGLLEELEEMKHELLTGTYPEDTVNEYVDSAVPIYNGELADLLSSDPHLAHVDTQGLCGNDDGIFQGISVAVYCELSEAASQWLHDAEFTLDDCTLVDDATLDTVILVCGEMERYDADVAAEYRDDDGELDFDRFCEEIVIPGLT
jgi:hypothetical protein